MVLNSLEKDRLFLGLQNPDTAVLRAVTTLCFEYSVHCNWQRCVLTVTTAKALAAEKCSLSDWRLYLLYPFRYCAVFQIESSQKTGFTTHQADI